MWSTPSSSTAHFRLCRIMLLVTNSVRLELGFQKEFIVVSMVAPGMSRTELIILAHIATGSWMACPFLCCVTVS